MHKPPLPRRAALALLLPLGFALGTAAPASAQEGWTVQLEGGAGIFKSTRDIGKILGTEVQAQIKTVMQTAPVYHGGFLLSGPSPKYTLRGQVSYMSTDARGRSGTCDVEGVEGPGCLSLDVPATSVTGVLDVLLHTDRGTGTLRYFVAGVGVRTYSFDEIECRGLQDFNEFAVCSPMMEFLTNQKGLVGRLGLGIRGRGTVGWSVEILDHVSQFEASGLRGEGGIQNDIVLSASVVFPGR